MNIVLAAFCAICSFVALLLGMWAIVMARATGSPRMDSLQRKVLVYFAALVPAPTALLMLAVHLVGQ